MACRIYYFVIFSTIQREKWKCVFYVIPFEYLKFYREFMKFCDSIHCQKQYSKCKEVFKNYLKIYRKMQAFRYFLTQLIFYLLLIFLLDPSITNEELFIQKEIELSEVEERKCEEVTFQ